MTALSPETLAPHGASLFRPAPAAYVDIPAEVPPLLLVVVDAEEEFDWSRGFSSAATAVTTIRSQERAQRLFARYGVSPTYAVDYPVAVQAAGWGPLAEFLQDGLCRIGAQLHPWVNPPLEEEVCEANSYPGNLPPRLEQAKLERLTHLIEDRFQVRPVLYRAGRWGAGPNTPGLLARLGYRIDSTVLPWADLSRRFGPDYRRCDSRPYWFGPGMELLEIPATAGMLGRLAPQAGRLFPLIAGPLGRRLHLPALFARSNLLERVRLTPEGVTLDEAMRLTRCLAGRGQRVFMVSYHSPSLEPGHTPYVRTLAERDRFLGWIEGYLEFFFGEMGGRAADPDDILALARARRRSP